MGKGTIISGRDPAGARVLSVLLSMRFSVAEDGSCRWLDTDHDVVQEPLFEGGQPTGAVLRDTDLYAWRKRTDLVVQGVVRSDRPVDTLAVKLQCRGPKKEHGLELTVSGDRRVERGRTGLRASDPEPLTEMPVTYARAYGGVDHQAPLVRELEPQLSRLSEPDQDRQARLEQMLPLPCAYPRNPFGKGYLVDPEGAEGLELPNLEFADDRLRLDRLAQPFDRWPEQPYPACFDWFHPLCFPRLGQLGLLAEDTVAWPVQPEVELGILDPEMIKLPMARRQRHEYAQCAHPYLWRHRLTGEEQIRVDAMSPDGRDFEARLRPLRPRVLIKQFGRPETEAPTVLDCVFIETEKRQLTMLWRASVKAAADKLPPDWMERCSYKLEGPG